MGDLTNLERVTKSDEEIIDLLMEDTKRGKLHWYEDDSDPDCNYIYTRMINKYAKIPGKRDELRIDTIFKISDQLIEEEEDQDIGYEFQDLFNNMISLDIYMSKNLKKEVFCRRILTGQLKLSNLLEAILPNLQKKPKPIKKDNG